MNSEYFETLHRLASLNESFVVVTLVSGRGHVPQDPGAKAIVSHEGLVWGTVGGGKVEARAIVFAREWLATDANSEPRLVTWNLTTDIGMSCGGEVTFLFERHTRAAWSIVIFGAGHVAQALTRVLEPLDLKMICVDQRPEWLERLPKTEKLEIFHEVEPARYLQKCTGKEFFVVMTQGHATDVPILIEIFRRFESPTYVGAIGSKVKALKIRNELRNNGVRETQLEGLRCPIGLALGTNAPAEIAISVAAELLQVRGNALRVPLPTTPEKL